MNRAGLQRAASVNFFGGGPDSGLQWQDAIDLHTVLYNDR